METVNALLNGILPFFNVMTLVVFIGLVIVSSGMMASRYFRLRRNKMGVPVLLKRDIALFGSFALYFGSVALVRALGLEELGDQWWWVMPRALMVLGAMGYWAYVESRLER